MDFDPQMESCVLHLIRQQMTACGGIGREDWHWGNGLYKGQNSNLQVSARMTWNDDEIFLLKLNGGSNLLQSD